MCVCYSDVSIKFIRIYCSFRGHFAVTTAFNYKKLNDIKTKATLYKFKNNKVGTVGSSFVQHPSLYHFARPSVILYLHFRFLLGSLQSYLRHIYLESLYRLEGDINLQIQRF